MYLIAKDKTVINNCCGAQVNLDLSQVWKVVKTPACKPGEYALFQKADEDDKKFSIFRGYVSYKDICESFEMIKYK